MNNILSIVWIFFMILNGTKGLDEDDILSKLNSMRARNAEQHWFSNMWKLSWDNDLKDTAVFFSTKFVDKLRNGKNYRLFMFEGTDDKAKEEEKKVDDFYLNNLMSPLYYTSGVNGNLNFDITWHFNEKFKVNQMKVGCAKYDSGYEVDGQDATFRYLCAIGPHGYIGIKDDPLERGDPGTKCINGKKEYSLCVPDPSITTSSPTITTETPQEPPTTQPTATPDQEFTTKDPEEEEWDLILYLNFAGGKGTLMGFFVVFFVILVV